MTKLQETRDLLGRLIAYPTVSSDSNLACIAELAQRLEDAGASVEIREDASGTRANLFATLGPEAPDGIVLSGHSDVVPVTGQDWSSDPFVMRDAGGKLYGRGTCDMKGFLAAAVTMAPLFAARVNRQPVHFAFTYDEEVGCLGARHLAVDLADKPWRPAICIVGEPTDMQVVDAHKGCHEYTTRFTGRAGHGSDPEAGVNAVEYAIRFAAALMDLAEDLKRRAPEDSPFAPPWSTICLGGLHGGIAHNVIPDHAEVHWDFRPVNGDDRLHVRQFAAKFCAEELLPAMTSVWGASDIDTRVIGEVDGLERRAENAARDLSLALLGQNAPGTVAFGTEGGIFQTLGMDVVICGPGSIAQAHKPDEYVEVAQLQKCLGFLEGLASRL